MTIPFRKFIFSIIVVFIFLIMMPRYAFSDMKIKQPNVSGQFYPSDPTELSKQIDQFMAQAKVVALDQPIDILIAPHAGYIYSGKVAGYSFKAVGKNLYKTIVILAPSHFFGFDGISIWDQGGFQTPLGLVPVDQEFSEKLIASNEKFYFEPRAFEHEHALEVELPFLQKTFKDFKIVPVVMGQATMDSLGHFAAALDQLIGQRRDILIVVSSDMSHYHTDSFARDMDRHTLEGIKALNPKQFFKEGQMATIEMCGYVPVTAAMLYAKRRGLDQVKVLAYANSSDATGDKQSVVGYSSVIIYGHESKPANVLTFEQKKRLIEIAKKTIREYVQNGEIYNFKETDPRLQSAEGAFVTIHKKGQLRGCLGNILGQGPLSFLVRDMAIASATKDARFDSVKPDEHDSLEIEISVLSKPRVIKNIDEIELGMHGVIVSQGFHEGIFLPQVATQTGWSKEEFLSQLCSQKAGLPSDAWKDPKTKIEIFTAQVFSQKDLE